MNVSELAVQGALELEYLDRGYVVIREKKLSNGRIDLLCIKGQERILIEVKERSGIKGAIGQLIAYSTELPVTDKRLVYFSRDMRYRGIANSTRRATLENGIVVKEIAEEIVNPSKVIEIERYIREGEEGCLTNQEQIILRKWMKKDLVNGLREKKYTSQKEREQSMVSLGDWKEGYTKEQSSMGLIGQQLDDIMW